jgi:hypothetical protein
VTKAGKSIFFFGFWVIICGVALMFFPKFVYNMMGMEMSPDLTSRILGMVLIFLAIYYFVAGRHPEFWPFYHVSIYTRSSALIVAVIFVLVKLADVSLIYFTIVDALGAAWTAFALRSDRAEGRRQ